VILFAKLGCWKKFKFSGLLRRVHKNRGVSRQMAVKRQRREKEKSKKGQWKAPTFLLLSLFPLRILALSILLSSLRNKPCLCRSLHSDAFTPCVFLSRGRDTSPHIGGGEDVQSRLTCINEEILDLEPILPFPSLLPHPRTQNTGFAYLVMIHMQVVTNKKQKHLLSAVQPPKKVAQSWRPSVTRNALFPLREIILFLSAGNTDIL